MDEHFTPPPYGDEKTMLLAFVNQQRAAVPWKLEGLTDEQLRMPHQPSGMSLLGLLKHLIHVEETWFVGRMLGEPVTRAPNDPEAWTANDEDSFDALRAWYLTVSQRSDEITRNMALDQLTAVHSRTYGPVSLQWILLHMIEEIARHLGHADFIRESIDGATGVNPVYEARARRTQPMEKQP
ncbi:MAG: DinB family protein [Thermomicrobiales bacterium]|nr:DinB family protein [Thermomicrobiales bacterium]MCO5225008.1 DinB family protein [Thermomicrobiales bacterium]MCO5227891.1 DinB family protein [Thermomicrobiales bacterium]